MLIESQIDASCSGRAVRSGPPLRPVTAYLGQSNRIRSHDIWLPISVCVWFERHLPIGAVEVQCPHGFRGGEEFPCHVGWRVGTGGHVGTERGIGQIDQNRHCRPFGQHRGRGRTAALEKPSGIGQWCHILDPESGVLSAPPYRDLIAREETSRAWVIES